MSVTIDGTTGLSGTGSLLSATNGGTGLTSVGTSGNVLTSNGTTWVSQALPAGGVTSLNGETGAITNTNLGSIGSVVFAIYTSTTSLIAGGTAAGSDLRYVTTIANIPYNSAIIFTQGNSSTRPQSMFQPIGACSYQNTGNVGYDPAKFVGTTTLSGTWRSMSGIPGKRVANYNACENYTEGTSISGCFVRVS